MGRKLQLTPELSKSICTLVQGGASIPDACLASGYSWNTVKVWIARGRTAKREQPFARFADELAQAKAKWRAGAVLQITKASAKDWRAAAWLLERRVDSYRPQQRIEHSGNMQHEHRKAPEYTTAEVLVRIRELAKADPEVRALLAEAVGG